MFNIRYTLKLYVPRQPTSCGISAHSTVENVRKETDFKKRRPKLTAIFTDFAGIRPTYILSVASPYP